MEKKQFKGWGVLVAAFLMSFIPTAIMGNCFSLYMAPVCADLGFGNSAWSMVNLIASFTSAIGAMIIAGFYQKKNMKVMLIIVTVGTGICWAIAPLCTAIWQFYLIFGISNVFQAGLTQLPISMLVTAWFEDKRGTMMSIAMAGGGLGGLVWSPVLTKFITASATGWKTAMWFSAAVVTVVMVICALFLVKRSPAEYGTEPYRDGSGAKAAEANKAASVAQDGGTLSGTVLSVYSLITIVGLVGGGALMDKIGIKKTVLIAVVLVCLGLGSLVLYASNGNAVIAYGYAIFFAIAMCLPKLLPSVLMSQVFGTKDYAGIYALANLFFLVGAALGSVLTSIIQGIVGYGMTWVVYIVIAILFFFCVVGAIKGGEKLKAQYPNGD